MSTGFHGTPCWYELMTAKGALAAAETFYGKVQDWTFEDSGMEGMSYHLAKSGDVMVAGLGDDDAPPHWLIYFAVDDADAFVKSAKAAGASVQQEPADIPGTGRFAQLTDPQGTAFGVLQPDMSSMSDEQIAKAKAGEGPYNTNKPGHGHWHELMSTDPEAGFAFYSKLFGWTKGDTMDMGEQGTYQLFSHNGEDLGGMMGLGDAPVPNWLPYFGVKGSVGASGKAIKAAGGNVHHGPIEVPGGAFIAVAQDPQGAWFAIVGAEK